MWTGPPLPEKSVNGIRANLSRALYFVDAEPGSMRMEVDDLVLVYDHEKNAWVVDG